jgi:hypothetical protein
MSTKALPSTAQYGIIGEVERNIETSATLSNEESRFIRTILMIL